MIRPNLLQMSILGSLLLVGTGLSAFAIPITYTEEATASGSLAGVPFTDATVLLQMVDDTATVADNGGGIFVNQGTLSVDVSGIGSGTFTDSIQSVSNQGVPLAGFGDVSDNLGILFTDNAGFASYDLTTSVGPLVGGAALNAGTGFATSDGVFILSSADSVSFTATTSAAAPEPSSLTLLGVAVAGLISRRSRGRSQA